MPSNWVMFDNGSFFIRAKGGALTGVTWGALGRCALSGQAIGGDCEAIPTNVIRYDSPVFAGFSVSADWGQGSGNSSFTAGVPDTANNGGYWDVYARYAGEWNGIKLAATSGWSQDNSAWCLQTVPTAACIGPGQNTNNRAGYWQSGIYIEHVATGLFAYGAYGREFIGHLRWLQ